MRFLHISDLHIGKRIYNIDLIEDQQHLLDQICGMAQEHACDAVLLAGDVYDKAQPSAQAIAMVDAFLSGLSALGIPVYVISGNHDNPAQISYCASILRQGNIFVCEQFDGRLQKFTVQDDYGPVDIFLLPFIRPTHVRRFFPQENIRDYQDAVRVVLEHADICQQHRSILVAHQFIAGAAVCESEELSIGGLEQISVRLFEPFCYTALGHLHSPQSMLDGRVRYCGSMLKYSFDERNQHKGALLVDLDGDGKVEVQKLPFIPLRDVREVKGTLEELIQLPYSEDYIQAVLTDEMLPMDARGSLRITFPNLLYLKMQNARLGQQTEEIVMEADEKKSPLEHFCDFYQKQNNGVQPDARRVALMRQALQEVEEQV